MAQTYSRRPFQGFLLTYGLTVGSLVAVSFLWGKPGFNLLIVAFGWPHVLLGLAFNVNRIARADLKSQILFGWLLLLTAVIAIGHSQVHITTLIYLYFVFHAFRDEIYMYYERNSEYRFHGRVFDARGRTVLLAALALALVSQLVPRHIGLQSQAHYVECAIAAILAGMALLRRPRRLFASRPGFRYMLPAVFLILAAMTGMEFLRMHLWNAPLFLAFLVIFHYFSWYVFSLEKIAAQRFPARNNGEERFQLFPWLRTRQGFLMTVVGLNVLSFAGAWSYQIRHSSTKLAYAFDLNYFLYFLVFHVTTSFFSWNATRTSLTVPFVTGESITAEPYRS